MVPIKITNRSANKYQLAKLACNNFTPQTMPSPIAESSDSILNSFASKVSKMQITGACSNRKGRKVHYASE